MVWIPDNPIRNPKYLQAFSDLSGVCIRDLVLFDYIMVFLATRPKYEALVSEICKHLEEQVQQTRGPKQTRVRWQAVIDAMQTRSPSPNLNTEQSFWNNLYLTLFMSSSWIERDNDTIKLVDGTNETLYEQCRENIQWYEIHVRRNKIVRTLKSLPRKIGRKIGSTLRSLMRKIGIIFSFLFGGVLRSVITILVIVITSAANHHYPDIVECVNQDITESSLNSWIKCSKSSVGLDD